MGDIFSKVCSDMSDDEDDNDNEAPHHQFIDRSIDDVISRVIKSELPEVSDSEDTEDSDNESEEDVKPKSIKEDVDSGDNDNQGDEDISVKPKKRKSRINMHIRRISRKFPYPPSGRVECAQCGRMVKFYESGKYKKIDYKALHSHAAYHLKKPIHKCQFCHLPVYKSSTRAHIKAQHAAEFETLTSSNAPIVCKMNDGIEDEVKEMLTKCFDKPRDGGTGQESDDKAIYQIKLQAQGLWKSYASGQSIHCNQCSRLISLNGSRYEAIEQHASKHLGLSLFKCNSCGDTKSTKQRMKHHVKSAHVLSSSEKNYADLRAESKKAIIKAMDRCFAPLADSALEVEAMEEGEMKQKSRDTTQILKARFGRNELELERRLHCTDLIKKHSSSGKIKCRVCEHQIGVNQHEKCIRNQKPLLHSFTHLQDGIHLFKCKRCEQPIKDMFSVYRHMKAKHQILNGIKKEIEDFTNDHHREIMENLTKCYDWTQEGQE